jgi:hypothetical protein
MRKAFYWKRSRISMLEVEVVPQSCIPQVQNATTDEDSKLRRQCIYCSKLQSAELAIALELLVVTISECSVSPVTIPNSVRNLSNT